MSGAKAIKEIQRRLHELGDSNPAESLKLLKIMSDFHPQRHRDKNLLAEAMQKRAGKERFSPPYDSPIEHRLAWLLAKHLEDDVTLHKQYECPTALGAFRVDLVAEKEGGRQIGFECDGAAYHQSKLRDDCRDALILGKQHVSAIIRFPGGKIHHSPYVCLLLAAKRFPWLFAKRSQAVIEQLVEFEANEAFERETANEKRQNRPVNREEFVREFMAMVICGNVAFTVNTLAKLRKDQAVKRFIEEARKNPNRTIDVVLAAAGFKNIKRDR